MFSPTYIPEHLGKRKFAHDDGSEVAIRVRHSGERPHKRFQTLAHGDFHRRSKKKIGALFDRRPRSVRREEAGDVVAEFFRHDAKKAIEYAHQISGLPVVEGNHARFIFFVDGSMSPKHPEALGGPGGYSVVYKGAESKEDHWIWQAWSVDETFNSHWAELMAIAEALNMAILRLSLKPTTRTAEIYLFTDSLRSLDFLMKKSSEAAKQSRRTTFFEHAGRPVRSFIARISRELHNLGVKLTLSHIPGHKHGVTGHIIADRTAHNVMVDRMEALQAPSKDQAPDSAVPNSLPSDLSLPKRRYIDDKVATRSSQHNPIWLVLHSHAVDRLMKVKRWREAFAQQQKDIRLLRELLKLEAVKGLDPQQRKEKENLMKKVGYLLGCG